MALAYKKTRGTDMFRQLEERVGVEAAQNYNPLYARFFSLNDTNWNHVTLDHAELVEIEPSEGPVYNCTVKDTGKRPAKVFFKMGPLVDPSKFLTGAYRNDTFELPTLQTGSPAKLTDQNNCAYVDGFFYYLTSRLKRAGFVHGVDFYGSYLGFKRDFRYNLEDDASYCINTSYFAKHHRSLFTVHDLQERPKLSMEDDCTDELEITDLCDGLEPDVVMVDATEPVVQEVVEHEVEVHEVVEPEVVNDPAPVRLSHSFCSSATSNTEGSLDSDEEEDTDMSTSSYHSMDDTIAIIHRFPVQVMAMEACEGTLDSVLRHMSAPELEGALLQIILTLAAYNRVFMFTHNDLHTNNVMYVHTDVPYLYYQYNDVSYKVPTHGKIFKLIDFGRGIYTFQSRRFVSDSFAENGDASSQYNIEPYFNEAKERLEPNYSFDLCRLACSMLDVLPESPEFDHLNKLVEEWCTDDKGRNVVYKQNGDERYPCFKLYKMIARTVHAHTADAQFRRPMFQKYAIKRKHTKGFTVMNLDTLEA